MKDFFKSKTGTKKIFRSRFAFSVLALACVATLTSCAIFATRPVQTMSDSAAAVRAARDANADTLAPDLFRQASDWFFKARNEYTFKNFDLAEEYAIKARKYAEQAEFAAIRIAAAGGTDNAPPPPADPAVPAAPTPAPAPAPEAALPQPTPMGTPIQDYDRLKAEEKPLPAAPEPDTSSLAPIPPPPAYINTQQTPAPAPSTK
jgi:hypothetical protein